MKGKNSGFSLKWVEQTGKIKPILASVSGQERNQVRNQEECAILTNLRADSYPAHRQAQLGATSCHLGTGRRGGLAG